MTGLLNHLGLHRDLVLGNVVLFTKRCLLHQSPMFYSLASQLWGLLLNFDRLVHEVECPNVLTNNHNLHSGGNFVFHHWGCILIHWLLSYPFR